MTQKSFAEALEETMSFIERALDRITRNEGAEAELHNVQAYVLNILELVDRDPGIDAAADDLQRAARFSRSVWSDYQARCRFRMRSRAEFTTFPGS